MPRTNFQASPSGSSTAQELSRTLAELGPLAQALYAGSLIAAAESIDGTVLASKKKLSSLAGTTSTPTGGRSRWEEEANLLSARRSLVALGLWEDLGRDRIRPVR